MYVRARSDDYIFIPETCDQSTGTAAILYATLVQEAFQSRWSESF
jgi:hypothetical protein